MESKKYQLFVSSTFKDLKDERQAVSRAVLNLGHIPAGMELFPATDTEQLTYIKKVIDNCDYYILIIGGRYGSTTEEGLSYTELEYNYAVEAGKPVLAFLHSEIGEISSKNVDSDKKQVERLDAFRKKITTGRVVEFWKSIPELESKVLLGVTNAFNESPQVGWRRNDVAATEEFLRKLEDVTASKDYWLNSYTEVLTKLEDYENLEKSEIEINYQTDSGVGTINISGEQIIRQLAVGLNRGLSNDNIAANLYEHILHKHDGDAIEVKPNSILVTKLFLEVFEIVELNEDDELAIRKDKKWLLKAAFLPLKSAKEKFDHEIPF